MNAWTEVFAASSLLRFCSTTYCQIIIVGNGVALVTTSSVLPADSICRRETDNLIAYGGPVFREEPSKLRFAPFEFPHIILAQAYN